MATLGKTTITDLNVLNGIKENGTLLSDKYVSTSGDTITGKLTVTTNGISIGGTDNAASASLDFLRGTYNYISSPSGSNIGIQPGGLSKTSTTGYKFDATSFFPGVTNTYNLGTSTLRWNNVYANTFNGNATSASKLGELISTQYMSKADNSGWPTLKLICDITPIYNLTSGGSHYGFVGSFIHSRTSGNMREGAGNLIARIGYNWTQRVLTTEDPDIVPCIISYNSKYYIALKLKGSGHGYQLYGLFINTLSEIIELKYTTGTTLPDGVTMIEEGTVLTLDDYVKSNTKNLQLNTSGTKYYKLVGLKTDSVFSNKNVLISSRNGLSIILTSTTNDSTKTFYAYKFCKTKLEPKITNIYYDTTTYDIYMKVGAYFNSITVSDLTNGGYDLTLSEVSSLPTTNLTEIPINEFLHSDNYTDYSLSLKGGTMDGDIVMSGVDASNSKNTKSKIIWGTGATISSNGNNVIINPTSSTLTGQIIITPGSSPSITVNGTKVSLDGHTHSYIPTSEKVNATAVTSTNFGTNGTYVPNMNFLSYWNGAYNSSGSSNLSYCKHGALGTAATKDTDYFATSGHTHSYLPLSGGTLTNDLSILTGDSDKFINYIYSSASPIGGSWRIGYSGSGTGDSNYFKLQSGTSNTSSSTWYDVVKFGQNTFDATFTGNILPSGNASKNLGSSSYKWNNVYAEDFNGNATSATKISKIVSLSSNSNTNTGKYRKFGTIEITSGWEYAGGLFHIYTQESFALDGLLACHIRSSSTIESESVSLYWLSINKSSMLDSISIMKTANGKFDLYFKANEHYMGLMIECYSQVPDKITLSSSGSWVDTITPRATSSDGRIYKFTGTAHSHTITPSGNVSSTFTGTAHKHTASLSGSVTSGVLTISVTVDNTTADGSVSSTFTGTSSQSTSSVTATGTIG